MIKRFKELVDQLGIDNAGPDRLIEIDRLTRARQPKATALAVDQIKLAYLIEAVGQARVRVVRPLDSVLLRELYAFLYFRNMEFITAFRVATAGRVLHDLGKQVACAVLFTRTVLSFYLINLIIYTSTHLFRTRFFTKQNFFYIHKKRSQKKYD
jgi:hypothetical protein